MVLFEKLKWTGILLAPFWLWLAAYLLIAPDSALVRFLVVGAGIWFLGLIQLICLGVLVFVMFPIIDEEHRKKQRHIEGTRIRG